MAQEHLDPRTSTEIIKDRLYFCALTRLPAETSTSHFFCIDDTLRYEPFFSDYGPLNLNLTYKFCQMLIGKLNAAEHAKKQIYFYCFNRPQNRSNAAVLIGIYLMVYGGRSSAQAYEPLKALEPYLPFRDASQGLCTFRLLPQHCLRAVGKALKLGWLNFDTWNSAEYEHFESVENGDLNIICPKKFLAFSGPHATNVSPDGYPTLTPTDYIPIFKMYGVSTVVRLNKKCYERKDFLQAGVDHHDMYFIDGTTPSQAILDRFLAVCEASSGMVAVHCKAGLGRTGSTIGCYLMKHFHLSAAETIAWLRLCRPGMVIGPQQHWLKMQEARMWKLGKALGTPASTGAATGAGAAAAASNSSSATNSPSPAHANAAAASSSASSAGASRAAYHPDPTPNYSLSQPNSPLSPNSPTNSSGQSYSASFDTPPTMHQQKINGGSHHHSHHGHNHHHHAANGHGASAAAAAPSSAASASPSYPQTRSMTSAAAQALQSINNRSASSASGLNHSHASPVHARGRSKVSRDLSGAGGSIDDHLSHLTPQPLRAQSGSRLSPQLQQQRLSPLSATSAPRNLFDAKPSPGAVVRRAPSATGLRRGPSSPTSASPTSPNGTSSSFAASLSTSPLAVSASASSSSPTAAGAPKSKPRSSQAPGIGFRQSKGAGSATAARKL